MRSQNNNTLISRYVLLWEDDMLMCGDENNGTLATVFDSIDKANTRASDWTGIRLGFGGNGMTTLCVSGLVRVECVCVRFVKGGEKVENRICSTVCIVCFKCYNL